MQKILCRHLGVEMASAEELLTKAAKTAYLSPLRYPGGKRKLVSRIGHNMDRAGILEFDRLIEPFAGGAAVSISFLEAGLANEIVLADRDPLIASFWQTVFSEHADLLVERIRNASVTLNEWKSQKTREPSSTVDAAYKCLFLNRTSYSGSLNDKAGPIGGQTQSGEYLIDCRFNPDALVERILELNQFSARVRVLNADFRSIVGRYLSGHKRRNQPIDVFWYLDPPFFHKADKLYRYSFASKDHSCLQKTLNRLDGKWLLSYDQCPEARKMYRQHPGYGVTDMRYTAHRALKVQDTTTTELIVSNFHTAVEQQVSQPKSLTA